jgi:uncharacterized protein (TIGR02118 family)
MIKVMTLLRRHPSLTREEFLDYWLNRHAPLVRSVPEFWRHVRGYRQNHAVITLPVFGAQPSTEAPATEGYDGCAELWFDSPESLQQAVQEPAYLAIIRPDELKCFADLSQAPVLIVTEHVIAPLEG